MVIAVANVAGMVIEDGFTKILVVKMGVKLGSANVLVAKHGLYGPKVSPAFQQSRREAVAERVWRDGFGYPRRHGRLLDHNEYHGAGEMRPPAVEEHVIFLAGLYFEARAVGEPNVEFVERTGGDGYKPLFVAFTPYPDKLLLCVDIRQTKV